MTVSVPAASWIFFVPAGAPIPGAPLGEVAVYRDANLLDDMVGTVTSLGGLGVILPRTDTDLASAATRRFVTLAVVPRGGGSVVLATTSSTADADWSAGTQTVMIDVAEGSGTVAVAHLGPVPVPVGQMRSLVVVERPGDAEGLLYFTTDDPTPRVVPSSAGVVGATPADRGETSPALVRLSPEVVELWSEDDGRLRRRRGRLQLDGTLRWEPPVTFDIPGIGGGDLDPFTANEGGGTVAVPFLGRTQVYLQRVARGISHQPFGGDPRVVSRIVQIRGRWSRRPAALNTNDPRTGQPAHVLVWRGSYARGSANRLVFAQKRSD